MSLSQVYNYDSGTGFIYDNTKIGFSGGNAVILPGQSNPNQTFGYNIAGASFNPSILTYSSPNLEQVDQRPANATFYAAWGSQLNGNWGNGSLTVSPFNGAAVVDGALNLSGSTNRYVSFSAIGNANSAQTGTIALQYTPQYSGTPTNPQYIVSVTNDGTNPNSFDVVHFTDGSIYFQMFDSSGGLILNLVEAWAPVSGTGYNFVINWDGTNGNSSVYINGVQLLRSTSTFTRNAGATVIYVGRNFSGTGNANFDIQNLSIYSTLLNPTNFALAPTIYAAASAIFTNFTYGGLGNVVAFTTVNATDANGVTYILNNLWWDGEAWTTSMNSSQSSSASVVNANIASFPSSNTLAIEAFFPAQSSQGMLSGIDITYTGQIYWTDDPTIEPSTAIGVAELDSFADSKTAMTGSAVRWALQIQGGSPYWWDGSAWAVSNLTYAQSNTTGDIYLNYPTFPNVPPGDLIQPIAIMHSTDGTVTPRLMSLLINYELYIPQPTPPTTCIVYAFLQNLLGISPSAGSAKLVITNPKSFSYGMNLIRSGTSYAYCDARGECQANVVESTTGNFRYFFQIQYVDDNGNSQITTLGWAQVPNQTLVDLSTLTFYPTEGGSVPNS